MNTTTKILADGFPDHNPMVCFSRGDCRPERARAIREGKALLRRMKGTGWTLRVWENLGWHYAVSSGPVTVHTSTMWREKRPTYFALVSQDPKGGPGGLSAWTYNKGRSSDPNRAASVAVGYAALYVEGLTRAVKAAQAAIGKKPTGRVL